MLVAALVPHESPAQEARAQDPRLERLGRDAGAAVARLLDSARAAALPTEPLVGVALEGVSRRVPAERVVQAVREYLGALRQARGALGASSSDPEVVSGAGAVISGVAPSALRALREARPRAPLTVSLVVLADLIARGVPADTAASAVVVAARASIPDADLATLRRYVERDIIAGVPPAAALAARLRNIPGVGPPRAGALERGPPEAGAARRPE